MSSMMGLVVGSVVGCIAGLVNLVVGTVVALVASPVTQATIYTGNYQYRLRLIVLLLKPSIAHILQSTSLLKVSSISIMTTKEESKPVSAASQRAETQALPELNQRSAVLGLWDVGIFRFHIYEFTYTQKTTGQKKSGADFRCTLVSIGVSS